MKRRKRHRFNIFAEILRIASDGAKRTRIVYQANLSFGLMKEYVQTLTERGLIEFIDGELYTTDYGFEFLEKFEEFMEVIKLI